MSKKNVGLAVWADEACNDEIIEFLVSLGACRLESTVGTCVDEGVWLLAPDNRVIYYADQEVAAASFEELVVVSLDEAFLFCPWSKGDEVIYKGHECEVARVLWLPSRGEFRCVLAGSGVCVHPWNLKKKI